MKRIFISTLVLAFALNCSAQTTSASNITVTPKVKAFAEEVFKNSPNFITPELLSVLQEHYNRMEVKQEPVSANEKYTLLSKTYFVNKYNPDLKKEGASFNPDTFNPVKYGLNFDAREDIVYRVDNTNYIIYIHKRS